MDKSQQQIVHEQTRERTICLNDFTVELTQYVHLKAKNEVQVIQETTCYESLAKKCICKEESQIANSCMRQHVSGLSLKWDQGF